MHVGCDNYTSFYLFKVMLPWFICFYTNLLFFGFTFCLFGGGFFVVLVFISFSFGLFFCFCLANKVELTKADLQGREGCSSPLLVSMKDAFM